MKSYLITGVAGFIGSHVAERLLERGERVVGIDEVNDYYDVRNKEQNLSLLAAYPSFSLVRGDIADPAVTAGAYASAAGGGARVAVGHLAARAGVRPSIVDPFVYEHANVRGTLVLLDEARRRDTSCFVLTSSSSVYGNSRRVPFKEDDSATDRPISPYAATKKATELLGATYHHLYGLPVNVVRPFTVYGPRGRPDMAPWIFLESALTGRPIKKFGDGSTRRDYTYVDDFVAGFVAALDRPDGYEIYNLGNSATVSLDEAIATIEAVTGRTLAIDRHPMQPGDVELTNADVSKARERLGYDPKTSFAEGMARFHEWFLRRGGPVR